MKDVTNNINNLDMQDAWVVFTGQTDLPWLKLLKPGFRHCYVLINDGRHWISIDPLFPYTEIIVHHAPADFNFPAWLAGRGYQPVRAQIRRDRSGMAPIMIFTCVEAIKRILGLHSWRILTPWQLYKYLVSQPNPPLKHKEISYGRTCIRAQAPKTA